MLMATKKTPTERSEENTKVKHWNLALKDSAKTISTHLQNRGHFLTFFIFPLTVPKKRYHGTVLQSLIFSPLKTTQWRTESPRCGLACWTRPAARSPSPSTTWTWARRTSPSLWGVRAPTAAGGSGWCWRTTPARAAQTWRPVSSVSQEIALFVRNKKWMGERQKEWNASHITKQQLNK